MSWDNNLWRKFGLAIGANIQDNQLALPGDWNDDLPSPTTHNSSSPRKNSFLLANQQPERDKRLQAV
ncbi:hypothetical protein HUU05_06410 [candidate division KSB1 bacterium]|nr:hypothetical protein [candidate division KSB1 bacterium]